MTIKNTEKPQKTPPFDAPICKEMGYATSDIQGTGGTLNQRNEDFLVEEIPLYEPNGQGEHLYLFIEKHGLNTLHVRKTLAKHYNVRKSDVSYAGLKDKNAITRQIFSIYLPKLKDDQPLLRALQAKEEELRFTVIWGDRHANKIRLGHLKGNRFIIKIRDVQPAHVLRVSTILKKLTATGCPNFYGPQRFGFNQNNHILGLNLLQKNAKSFLDNMLGTINTKPEDNSFYARDAYENDNFADALENWPMSQRPERQALQALVEGNTPDQAVEKIEPKHRMFLATSFQSYAFNLLLAQRLKDNNWNKLIPGELAFKHDNGSLFQTTPQDLETENAPQGRVPSQEISPSGPLWGTKVPESQDQAATLETQALEVAGLTIEKLHQKNPLIPHLSGDRRSLRMTLTDAKVSAGADEHGPYIETTFTLGKGCFATAILREIMKPQS